MLLGMSVAGAHMACVFPQDDQIIPRLPDLTNRPLRILVDTVRPEQREPPPVRVGANCSPFSFNVFDPDVNDRINARWFIDPNERYIAAPNMPSVNGNLAEPLLGTPQTRLVRNPPSFLAQLSSYADGRKHRVEVIVTDGEFFEESGVDMATGERRDFLTVVRPPVAVQGAPDGGIRVPAYRDEYVWLVEVSTSPCQ
jgi:hypothetical protein